MHLLLRKFFFTVSGVDFEHERPPKKLNKCFFFNGHGCNSNKFFSSICFPASKDLISLRRWRNSQFVISLYLYHFLSMTYCMKNLWTAVWVNIGEPIMTKVLKRQEAALTSWGVISYFLSTILIALILFPKNFDQ